jgi:uncharacterized DUF497 family protein
VGATDNFLLFCIYRSYDDRDGNRIDSAKDAINRKKHDVSLKLAEALVWEEACAWPDDRFDYDDWRMRAWFREGTGFFTSALWTGTKKSGASSVCARRTTGRK